MARRRRGGSSIDSLQAATTPNVYGLNVADPLGINAQSRGLDTYWATKRGDVDRSFEEQNPLLASSAITGPLPDPQWAGWFQTLADNGVRGVRGGSTPGSNQLTGTSAQPDWMPTYSTAPGVSPTGTATDALDALRQATTPQRPPMVDDRGQPMPSDQQTTTAPQAPPAPKAPPLPPARTTATDALNRVAGDPYGINAMQRQVNRPAVVGSNSPTFSAFLPNPTPQPFVPSGPAAPSVRSTMSDVLSTIRKKNPR